MDNRSDNVITGDFTKNRLRPSTAQVQVTFNIDRSVCAYIIENDDRSRDQAVGIFTSHADAIGPAMAAAAQHRIKLIDMVAIEADGIWNLRPVAAGIHVYPASSGGFWVNIEPSDGSWEALGAWSPTLEVAGDRAVELREKYRLEIVDHVFVTGGAA